MSTQIGLFEHFRLLFSFRGREDPGSFWPYAVLVFGILTTCNVLMVVPMMMSVGNIYASGLVPSLPNFAAYFAIMAVVGVLLYAAAVARRLRDSGRSPLWGLMPIPFGAISIIGMIRIFRSPFDGIPPDTTMMQLMMVGNALYTLSIIALIAMLTMRSASLSSDHKAKKQVPHYHEE